MIALFQLILMGLLATATTMPTTDGGGVAAIICPNGVGGLKPSQLLDLNEASYRDDTFVVDARFKNLTWKKIVEKVVERVGIIDPAFNSALRFAVTEIADGVPDALARTAGTTQIFPAPQDLGPGRLPPMELGCQLAGAAEFSDYESGMLSLSELIWQSLNEAHRAALVIDLALYRVLRMTERVEQSYNLRQFVALVFSQAYGDYSDEVVEQARDHYRMDAFFVAPVYPSSDHLSPDKNAEMQVKVEESINSILPTKLMRHSDTVYLNLDVDHITLRARQDVNITCQLSVKDIGGQISSAEMYDQLYPGTAVSIETPGSFVDYRFPPMPSNLQGDGSGHDDMFVNMDCHDNHSGLPMISMRTVPWHGMNPYYDFGFIQVTTETSSKDNPTPLSIPLGDSFSSATEIRSKERYAKDYLQEFKLAE
jgi:hypothetical protein